MTVTTTIETRTVRTAPGMAFDDSVAGDPGRPLVLMLHGFRVSRHYWETQAVALAEAGYFAAAPNQRGYAPGARPHPRLRHTPCASSSDARAAAFHPGDADDTVGRVAAEGTGEFIKAPYTFAALAGVGHYAVDQVPDLVNAPMLAHPAKHPVSIVVRCWQDNLHQRSRH